ncbi:hypothetical protein [Aquibacillus rhizosphaerae]|uniref:DUF4870 domain-containing protein n=1 Tax=Aquibacillus rhizosphaerae TaxID=3051431 RepID=A0ABT7L0Z6_9BACI|nr:hypothetical protein [Aquibacillus sp. LR5S19]MDL4839516.1 hypothetical protein [Aquibacillus sp. LR5S19]
MSENMNAENSSQEQANQTSKSAGGNEEAKDAEENKGMGILAYIIFFVPILAAKESKFAMYHANQGLSLFLLFVGVNIVATIIPIIGWFIIFPVGYILACVLLVMGIINAANGKKKPLPMIGKWNLIK